MRRREFLFSLFSGVAASSWACGPTPGTGASGRRLGTLGKPKQAWRSVLPRPVYYVLFEEDTELPFSSPLNTETRDGTYLCAACFHPLFESSAKFDSGTGWPSFTHPIEGHVATRPDHRIGIPRTEYHCVRCGGHQGHVFPDGPPPTGQRWCNNGLALRFIVQGTTPPALRS